MYRIQKILSSLRVVSRRNCEKLIIANKIKVNGKTATLGQKVYLDDIVNINNKNYRITTELLNKKTKIIAYHKKIGEIVSRKTKTVNNTVFEKLPTSAEGWINVGRLDVNTSGLLLFTNNGDLANNLMHPSSEIERRYQVIINGKLSLSEINKTLKGVPIGKNQFGKFLKIRYFAKDNIYEVSLITGKNREIRRIFKFFGYKVEKLHRIAYGDIYLRGLKEGRTKSLSNNESKLFFY